MKEARFRLVIEAEKHFNNQEIKSGADAGVEIGHTLSIVFYTDDIFNCRKK
jgi:hypothetical protein